jgi:hypothetical protein
MTDRSPEGVDHPARIGTEVGHRPVRPLIVA